MFLACFILIFKSSSCKMISYFFSNKSYYSNPLVVENIYKMNELKSVEACSDLSTEFRVNEINKIKDYFESEIKEQETMVKKLSKYSTGFDYTDKTLIVLPSVFSGISIFLHLKIKKHTGLISSCFILLFLLTTSAIKAIIDLQISHEEFEMIVNEKKDYDNQKENIINKGNKIELSENV